MGTGIQELLDTVAELKEKADVNAIFGEPVTVEGRTIIPVARVGYGFGIGFGQGSMPDAETGDDDGTGDENKGEGEPEATGESVAGGSGGGVYARPFAVIEVTAEGTRVESIVDEQKLTMGGLLLVAWSVFWLAATLMAIFAARTTVRLSEQKD